MQLGETGLVNWGGGGAGVNWWRLFLGAMLSKQYVALNARATNFPVILYFIAINGMPHYTIVPHTLHYLSISFTTNVCI